ncbi:MAG: hypothetical protein HC851_23680, partial [Acaryochloris sp. RU_4_1]|nr:hypothetical protein [Acaryochloris sp. RU_4_1]
MELKYQNFIDEKYRELQEAEQLVFSARPKLGVVKKGIQIAAVPGVAVVATHAPIVGPFVASAVAQGTHLMHSGIHNLAADRIAHHFAELSANIEPGWTHWARQKTFDAWASVRTMDMLAKTDMWARPLSGFAAPTIVGKSIIDTGKLAISYAKQGIPTVVARPIVHIWQRTNYLIHRAQAWFEAMLSKLPEQVQQNVRSAIDNIQRRTTAMAAEPNQSPTPNEPDPERRAEYVRLLSEHHKDPGLTYEQIAENIQGKPDLGTDYDKQVVYQALTEGKTLDEATAIIAQGPNVVRMSENNLQDVSVYLAQTTNSVWKQYNVENAPPEVNPQGLDNGMDIENLQGRQTLMADPNHQSTAIEPDLERRAEYARLLSEYHKDPGLTYEQIEQNIHGKPDLALAYDEQVAYQALREGKDIDEATAIVANGPTLSEMSENKPQDIPPYLAETTNSALEQYNYDNSSKEAEDLLMDKIVNPLDKRGVDTSRLAVFYNGEQIFGMKAGDIDRRVTQVSDERMEAINEALHNFKDFEGEFKVKVGNRVVLHLKEGQKLVDTYNLAPQDMQRPEGQFKTKEQLKQEQSQPIDPRLEQVRKQGGNIERAQKYFERADQIAKVLGNGKIQTQPNKEPALAHSEPE